MAFVIVASEPANLTAARYARGGQGVASAVLWSMHLWVVGRRLAEASAIGVGRRLAEAQAIGHRVLQEGDSHSNRGHTRHLGSMH